MNHRSQVLNFSSALNGFLQYKLAERLSPATVFNYERDLKLWLEHMGDQDIGRITSADFMSPSTLRPLCRKVPRRSMKPPLRKQLSRLDLSWKLRNG